MGRHEGQTAQMMRTGVRVFHQGTRAYSPSTRCRIYDCNLSFMHRRRSFPCNAGRTIYGLTACRMSLQIFSAATGNIPLRHCENPPGPTPTGDYQPSLRSPWLAASVLVQPGCERSSSTSERLYATPPDRNRSHIPKGRSASTIKAEPVQKSRDPEPRPS
jgi:hypothetical protein